VSFFETKGKHDAKEFLNIWRPSSEFLSERQRQACLRV